jgi:hypothetical protein
MRTHDTAWTGLNLLSVGPRLFVRSAGMCAYLQVELLYSLVAYGGLVVGQGVWWEVCSWLASYTVCTHYIKKVHVVRQAERVLRMVLLAVPCQMWQQHPGTDLVEADWLPHNWRPL